MKTKKLLITISENSMTRITWFGPESASPAVREIYDTTLRGKPGSVQEMLAHLPRVCLINECRHCAQHHVAPSKRVGLTAED